MSYPATCLLGNRLNAFRLNHLLDGRIYLTLGGSPTGPTQDVLVDSLNINDQLNENPNTLTATVRGTKPVEGAVVVAALGSRGNVAPPLFAGNILRVTRVWAADNPRHMLYHIEATDPTWRLNAVLVSGRYTLQSATDIAADLLTFAPPGFTGAFEAGLPEVVAITFTNATLMDAFAQLATRIGGYTYCDYQSRIHLFSSASVEASPPRPLDATHPSLSHVSYVRDLTQIVTRAIVEGGGSRALESGEPGADHAAEPGAASISIEEASWYNAAGGLVVSGPQRISYTGITVIPGAGAPTVALVPGTPGALVGTFRWAVTFGNDLGELPPSVMTTPLVCPAFPAPTSAALVTLTGLGPLIGAYRWAMSHVTELGETELGAVTFGTAVAQSGPTAPTVSNSPNLIGNLIGNYLYKSSNVSAVGESVGTASGTVSAVALVPAAPGMTGSGSGAGSTRSYVATFVDPATGRESVAGSSTSHVNTSWNYSFSLTHTISNLQVWRLYRTTGGGSVYKLLGEALSGNTIPDNNIADASLGPTSPPLVNFVGRGLTVSSIATGPTGTLGRRLYRTRAGGSQYFLVAEIAGNASISSFVDNVPDDALAASPPLQNLSGQLAILTIPTGPTGTLARRLYRTKPSGTVYERVGEIADNVTTTFTDDVPDGSLGGAPQLLSKAGGTAVQVSAIPLGALGVTKRILYRTDPESPVSDDLKYLDTINDNVTTTYLDDGKKTTGREAPLVSTIGAQLVGIPASGAGAILYPITKGDPVNLLVLEDDLAAQTALAALVGGDGVRESLLQDGRISETEARERGVALLARQKDVLETFAHRSRDPLTRAGATINVNLPAPTDIVGTFRLQDVTISTFNPRGVVMPTFGASSSSQRFTFEDLVRRLTNTTPAPATGEDR